MNVIDAHIPEEQAKPGIVVFPPVKGEVIWLRTDRHCPFCESVLQHPHVPSVYRVVQTHEPIGNGRLRCSVVPEPDDVDILACRACNIVFSTKEPVRVVDLR